MTAHNNKQTTTNNADELNLNACRKHQDKEVFGEFGQRGCVDCVWTARYTDQLLREILEELPEKQDEHPMEDGVPVETYGYEEQHNQLLDTITATIKSKLRGSS